MKKYLVILSVMMFLFNFIPQGIACQGMEGKQCARKGGHGSHDGAKSPCPLMNALLMQAHESLEHSKDLGLSADQIKTIREIKIEAKKFNIHMKAEMEIMGIDMKSKLWADEFDAEGLKKMIDGMAASMPEGGKKTVDLYAKFRSTLTADQWQKLKELR